MRYNIIEVFKDMDRNSLIIWFTIIMGGTSLLSLIIFLFTKKIPKDSKSARYFAIWSFIFGILSFAVGFITNPNFTKDFLDKIGVEASFIPDFSPGKENFYGNKEYINNAGRLAKQGDMFYIASTSGIFKTKDFKSLVKISEVDAFRLNVVGNWLYYVNKEKIYRMKTDGSKNKLLYEGQTDYGITSLQVYSDTIYFIDYYDHHLYSIYIEGGKATRLTDDLVSNFYLVNAYIYYTTAEFDDNALTTKELKVMTTSGKNSTILLKNTFDKNKSITFQVPSNFAIYQDELVFLEDINGLYRVPYGIPAPDFEFKIGSEIERLNKVGGYGLSIVNDIAYYSPSLIGKVGYIYSYNFKTKKTDDLGKPFENDKQLHLLYPLHNGNILVTQDAENWYIYNKSDAIMELIKFETIKK